MKRWLLIFLGHFVFLTDFCQAQTPSSHADISVTKIFDDGCYNCFTDLVRFNDTYYCAFRSAISHGDPSSGVIGKIAVIRSTDLNQWMIAQGKRPLVAVAVVVEEYCLQCAKALIRSKLWQSHNRPSLESLPSAAEMFCDQVKMPDLDVPKLQSLLDEAYKNRLY